MLKTENFLQILKTSTIAESPSFIGFDNDNNLIVLDESTHKIFKLDEEFNIIWESGCEIKNGNEFFYPTAFACSDRYYYITDRWNHCVRVFDYDGKYIDKFGVLGDKDDCFMEVWGIALVGDDLFVSDRGNGKIKKFDINGNYKSSFGEIGTLPYFYSSERFKRTIHFDNWIKRIDIHNRIESLFFEAGYSVGEFEFPEHLAFYNDKFFVADKSNANIVVYDINGVLQCHLHYDNNDYLPDCICKVDDVFIVTDEINSKLHILSSDLFKINEVKCDMRPYGICYNQVKKTLYLSDSFNGYISKVKIC